MNIGCTRNAKILSVLHLVWFIYLFFEVLVLDIIKPHVITPSEITIGEKIILLLYLPHMILNIVASIGLWQSRRWGWCFAVVTYVSVLIFQFEKIIQLTFHGAPLWRAIVNEGLKNPLILALLISLMGIIICFKRKSRDFFRSNARIIVLTFGFSMLYWIISKLIYNLIT